MTMYREYRPQELAEMIGNRSVIKSMDALLDRMPDIPHSYMITGPTGCGKTTLARIMATELGCDEALEYNSSQLTGIDFVRNLTESLSMKPLMGDVTVAILDECHEMSAKAQEGLLKVLEEPPEHAYIILLTTLPQKLKSTIRNRCTKWEVSPLTDKQIKSLLDFVLEEEGTKISKEVADLIVDKCEGVPREMFSLLEPVINLDNKEAVELLKGGVLVEKQTIDLMQALVDSRKKWIDIANILKRMNFEDPEKLRVSIMGYCASCLLATKEDVVPVMEAMEQPFFNTGKNGFILACYKAVRNRR
jgi:DNA polymerase-3 subunit gamma/tau